jgi:hypothetical protein
MKRLLLLFFVAAPGLLACGQAPNDLWGSIDESFPLDFDRVEILKQNLALRIEYLKDVHGGTNKICKLTIDTDNIDISDGTELRDDVFDRHVTLERVSSTQSSWPPLDGGKLKFQDYNFEEDGHMDGEFTVVFDNGRNLSGTFDGKVKIISTQ